MVAVQILPHSSWPGWEERWWPARLESCIFSLFNFWLGFCEWNWPLWEDGSIHLNPAKVMVGKIFSALTSDCTAVDPRTRVRGINVDYNPDTLWLADSCKYGYLQQHGFATFSHLDANLSKQPEDYAMIVLHLGPRWKIKRNLKQSCFLYIAEFEPHVGLAGTHCENRDRWLRHCWYQWVVGAHIVGTSGWREVGLVLVGGSRKVSCNQAIRKNCRKSINHGSNIYISCNINWFYFRRRKGYYLIGHLYLSRPHQLWVGGSPLVVEAFLLLSASWVTAPSQTSIVSSFSNMKPIKRVLKSHVNN